MRAHAPTHLCGSLSPILLGAHDRSNADTIEAAQQLWADIFERYTFLRKDAVAARLRQVWFVPAVSRMAQSTCCVRNSSLTMKFVMPDPG